MSGIATNASQTKHATGFVDWKNNELAVKKTFTAVGHINWTNTGANPAISVNGTAHASGTANANGNWGTATGGKTLVGELGRENFATAYGDVCIEII